MTSTGNVAAFARARCGRGGEDYDPGDEGMSLRDYFAAHAPADLLRNREADEPWDLWLSHTALCRYEYADAMIDARSSE